ncbi:MAG TPA: hypothetical protein VGU19_03275 [Microvirga sp.]|jgi:hypothetical protein|nr:hypothetical protein [Microvirga sp.]
MAVEAGAEVVTGLTPAERLVRSVFDFDVYRPSLRFWNDQVRGANEVFKVFAAGEDVPPGRLLSACQIMAQLEILNVEGRRKINPVTVNPSVHVELLKLWENLTLEDGLRPFSLAILDPAIQGAGVLTPTGTPLFVDGTLVEVVAKKGLIVNRDDLRRIAAKAAQARLCGLLPSNDRHGNVTVDRIAFLFTRHNRMMEFGLEEIFGSDGWERYLEGFADLAGMEPERELEPDLMPMMG